MRELVETIFLVSLGIGLGVFTYGLFLLQLDRGERRKHDR